MLCNVGQTKDTYARGPLGLNIDRIHVDALYGKVFEVSPSILIGSFMDGILVCMFLTWKIYFPSCSCGPHFTPSLHHFLLDI